MLENGPSNGMAHSLILRGHKGAIWPNVGYPNPPSANCQMFWVEIFFPKSVLCLWAVLDNQLLRVQQIRHQNRQRNLKGIFLIHKRWEKKNTHSKLQNNSYESQLLQMKIHKRYFWNSTFYSCQWKLILISLKNTFKNSKHFLTYKSHWTSFTKTDDLHDNIPRKIFARWHKKFALHCWPEKIPKRQF